MPWPFSGKSTAILGAEPVDSSPSRRTRFAFKLFHEFTGAGADSNIFFSPPSVMACLALVHELASAETRESMAKVLEIAGLDHVAIGLEIASLKSAFSPRVDAEISFANAIFLGRFAQIDPELRSRLSALYDAELNGLDFFRPDAVAAVNAWVSAKTKGKIPQIVSELSPLTALVALNAVYFKSRWEEPFRKEFTRDHPFRTASQTIKQLPMMIQNGTYNYYEDPRVQVAALPYGGNVSMYIVLPGAKADLAQFREDLTSGLWESWLSKSTSTLGTIQLPRFKVDYQAELNSPLKALGMERAFDPDRAQFEHVHADRPPVWIDRVVHRALAEVNEEGTKAAAATMTVAFCGASLHQKPPKRFQMIVDHPFFALIRDERTRTILFMGWICDPQ